MRKVLEEGRHPAPEHLPWRRQPSRPGCGCSGKKGRFCPQTQRRTDQNGSNTAERQAGSGPTMAAGDPPRVRRASMITERKTSPHKSVFLKAGAVPSWPLSHSPGRREGGRAGSTRKQSLPRRGPKKGRRLLLRPAVPCTALGGHAAPAAPGLAWRPRHAPRRTAC